MKIPAPSDSDTRYMLQKTSWITSCSKKQRHKNKMHQPLSISRLRFQKINLLIFFGIDIILD
jgi:hypothetical protein